MRRANYWLFLAAFWLLIAPISSDAQENTCPVLVETALNAVGDACSGIGLNQVCYGNTAVSAQDWENAPLTDFTAPGDLLNLADVATLATFPMNLDEGVWGIAELAVRANLPGTVPGQKVVFILYGDVELTSEVMPVDAARPPLTCAITAGGNVNLRSGPGTTYAVAGGLAAGDSLTTNGRNAAGDWLRLDRDGAAAWVYAPLVTPDCDLDILSVVEPGDSQPGYVAPMQAFRFTTGIGKPACVEAPRDGLLIQAPKNTTVNFLINGVDLAIGSTALLHIDEADTLFTSTLDGTVMVTAGGESRTVEPGYQVMATWDKPPSEPEAYDYADVRHAPVRLLPEKVIPPFVLSGVDGSTGWVDTGIQLRAGQSFTISASGEVSIWPGCRDICTSNSADTTYGVTIPSCAALCDAVTSGPAGSRLIEEVAVGASPYFPMPEALMTALVGRIGAGDPFYVGEGGTFTADREGTLQLHINEDSNTAGDETGAFIVRVAVDTGS